jgi:nicotinamidase-related amidase
VEAARQNAITVIHVRIAFSEGYPEVSQKRALELTSKYGGITFSDTAAQIHQSVQPKPHEPIVTKYRSSAFSGSNLEVILYAQQIETLVLSGIATSGVVLSTLREASDKDFKLKVLADGCFDPDPEVHRVLIEKVFPRQSDVMTVDSWIDSLK